MFIVECTPSTVGSRRSPPNFPVTRGTSCRSGVQNFWSPVKMNNSLGPVWVAVVVHDA